jgi:hypothetical protein
MKRYSWSRNRCCLKPPSHPIPLQRYRDSYHGVNNSGSFSSDGSAHHDKVETFTLREDKGETLVSGWHEFVPQGSVVRWKLRKRPETTSEVTNMLHGRCLFYVTKRRGKWVEIYYKNSCKGWTTTKYKNIAFIVPVEDKPYKEYEVWPGRNRFFCKGKCMIGPNLRLFAFTNILLISTSVCNNRWISLCGVVLVALCWWGWKFCPTRCLPHTSFEFRCGCGLSSVWLRLRSIAAGFGCQFVLFFILRIVCVCLCVFVYVWYVHTTIRPQDVTLSPPPTNYPHHCHHHPSLPPALF